jgi:hypothetical protein
VDRQTYTVTTVRDGDSPTWAAGTATPGLVDVTLHESGMWVHGIRLEDGALVAIRLDAGVKTFLVEPK